MTEYISSSSVQNDIEVLLDGAPVQLPPRRASLAGVRSYLERLAMQQQRILSSFTVDGQAHNLAEAPASGRSFSRVIAETIDLSEMPLQLMRTARLQTTRLRAHAMAAVTLVLIKEKSQARELWWSLACELKQPLLTLSLMPETSCGPEARRVPLIQLRKWQLEQLAFIIKDLDEACALPDTTTLSNALESRVLPWLDGLRQTLELWHNSFLMGFGTR
jgi:hypothetical protein